MKAQICIAEEIFMLSILKIIVAHIKTKIWQMTSLECLVFVDKRTRCAEMGILNFLRNAMQVSKPMDSLIQQTIIDKPQREEIFKLVNILILIQRTVNKMSRMLQIAVIKVIRIKDLFQVKSANQRVLPSILLQKIHFTLFLQVIKILHD